VFYTIFPTCWCKTIVSQQFIFNLLVIGLTNLDFLKLGYNQIKELGPYVFRNLNRMSQLDLESNLITSIHDRAFKGLEGILNLIFCFKYFLPSILKGQVCILLGI